MTHNGAPGAHNCEELLGAQLTQMGLMLSRLLTAMNDEIARSVGGKLRPGEEAHPYNVFCIDGGRGAGKTYFLLTLERLLKSLAEREDLHTFSESWKKLRPENLWERATALRNLRRKQEHTLLTTMRVIFPGDMERQELLLESIFANIRRDIEQRIEACRHSEAGNEWKALRTKLIKEIGAPWSFARRVGLEAVTRNSIGYDDMFQRLDDLSMAAAERIPTWRKFLDGYLDARRVSFLVILLDDSDARPELTHDILNTAATVLNHPRIVTVIAGNTKAMRRSLISLAMRELGPAMNALNQRAHPTGELWRRDERFEIEQRLEKILPDAHRFYLGRPDLHADFERLTEFHLVDVCDAAMQARWESFAKIKMLRALNHEIEGEDLPEMEEAAQTQDYLSWWAFRNHYLSLSPASPRQIETFREYYIGNLDGKTKQKRLPVMLFANPANYQLGHRLTDNDPNLIEWLTRQNLESSWVGQRSFSVNGRKIMQGSFSYDYIQYRFDIGLSQPIRHNSEAVVPNTLLPHVAGRQRMRPFYLPRSMPKQPRRLGVAHWLDHSAIPGNCLYFSDLSALPGVFFVRPKRRSPASAGGNWEADLWATWPGLIEAGEDETIQRYLTQVVFKSLRNAHSIRTSQLIDVLEPLGPAGEDPPPYQPFFKNEMSLMADPAVWESRLEKAGDQLRGRPKKAKWKSLASPPPDEQDPGVDVDGIDAAKRILARYAALTNDLRRGAAALTIYKSNLKEMKASEAPSRFGPAHRSMEASIANSEKMRLYPLETLKKTIGSDEWAERLLRCCDKNKIKELVLKGSTRRGPAADLFDRLKSAELSPQADDATAWVGGWRQIGRLLCDGWYLEDDREREFLRPSATAERAGQQLLIHDDSVEMQARWRSARSLAWLLYGIAPTLPALAHIDIASRLHRLHQLQHRLRADKSKNIEEAITAQISDVEKNVKEWLDFIFALTCATRYLKMKSLHLHCILITHWAAERYQKSEGAMNDGGDEPTPTPSRVRRHVDRLREEILNLQPKAPGRRKVDSVWARREEPNLWAVLAESLTDSRKPIEKIGEVTAVAHNTNMMPDAAPSTLFGEGWLRDVTLRLFGHDPKESEEGISYGGVFGETERWLWAAHYMVRTAATMLQGVNLKT